MRLVINVDKIVQKLSFLNVGMDDVEVGTNCEEQSVAGDGQLDGFYI